MSLRPRRATSPKKVKKERVLHKVGSMSELWELREQIGEEKCGDFWWEDSSKESLILFYEYK